VSGIGVNPGELGGRDPQILGRGVAEGLQRVAGGRMGRGRVVK